jgi:AcrR family transcriptional regulator
MKERRRRTRRQRRQDRHNRLLEAAEGLFVRRGFDKASVEEIGDAAGCSPGAFYSHFADKEQALRAVIEMRRPAVLQALDDLFLGAPNANDRLAAVRRAVFRSVAAMGIPGDGPPRQTAPAERSGEPQTDVGNSR